VLAGGGTDGIVAQLQGYSDLAIFGTSAENKVELCIECGCL
jgi:hypothetical protein